MILFHTQIIQTAKLLHRSLGVNTLQENIIFFICLITSAAVIPAKCHHTSGTFIYFL